MVRLSFLSWMHKLIMFWHLLSVSLTVIVTEHKTNPKNTICLHGFRTDFSVWTVSPRSSISDTVSIMFLKHSWYVNPTKHESSIYAVLMCPSTRRCAKTGFRILVKILGLEVNPMTKAVNWNFFTLMKKPKVSPVNFAYRDGVISICLVHWPKETIMSHRFHSWL